MKLSTSFGRTAKRVTLCRDARLVRPLYQRLQDRDFNGDGRTSRASLQRVTRLAVWGRTLRPSVPTKGYTSRSSTTDAPTICARAVHLENALRIYQIQQH